MNIMNSLYMVLKIASINISDSRLYLLLPSLLIEKVHISTWFQWNYGLAKSRLVIQGRQSTKVSIYTVLFSFSLLPFFFYWFFCGGKNRQKSLSVPPITRPRACLVHLCALLGPYSRSYRSSLTCILRTT